MLVTPDGDFRVNDAIGRRHDVDFLLACKKVTRLLDKNLGLSRTALVFEGMGVNHVHCKLYPLHGVGKEWKEIWAAEKVFFEKYMGYISTQLGSRADDKKLAEIAQKIRGE